MPLRLPSLRTALVTVGGALLALGLCIAALLAWLPGFIDDTIEREAAAALGREVRVERVGIEATRLTLVVEGLAVAPAGGFAAGGEGPLAVARVEAALQLGQSLWHRAPVVESLRVVQPRVRLARGADGVPDLADVIERLAARPAPPPGREPARFALHNLELEGGSFTLEDRAAGTTHRVEAIALALPFLSNLPAHVEVRVKPRVQLRFAGREHRAEGEALPFADVPTSELRVALDALPLATIAPYLPRGWPLKIAGGAFSANAVLRFEQPAARPPRLHVKGGATIAGMAVEAVPAEAATPRSEAAARPLLGWQRLTVAGIDAEPLARRASIGTVRLEGATAWLRREAGGALDVAGLVSAMAAMAPRAAEPAAANPASAAPAAGWRFGLERFEIADARLHWRDEAARAALDLHVARAGAGPAAWPPEPATPTAFDATFTLHRTAGAARTKAGAAAPTRELARARIEGTAEGHRAAALRVEVSDADLAAAAPYLRDALGGAALAGRVEARASARWQAGEGEAAARTTVALERLEARGVRLGEGGRGDPERPGAELARLVIEGAEAEPEVRRLRIAALTLDRPMASLRRAADGALETPLGRFAAGSGPGPGRAAGAPAEPPPWRAELGTLQLTGGALRLEDARHPLADGTPRRFELAALRLTARQLGWPAAPAAGRGASPMASSFEFGGELRPAPGDDDAPGRLLARGRFGLAPLAVEAELNLERLPLSRADAYLADRLPVALASGDAGFRGRVAARAAPAGLEARIEGEALLADFSVRARSGAADAGRELLAWRTLAASAVSAAIAPGAPPDLRIGEVVLEDFHSQLVITEAGRFDLRDVQGAAAPASAPTRGAAPAGSPPAAGLPLSVTVGGVRLANGRIAFTDRFVRPNFSADLTQLNGRLGRFSSASPREMATLELEGRAAGTARLEVRGALNPTADPLALDIAAKATDLELAPLSPYSGKYAGYLIERGKLSLDVSYRVEPDGRLDARNQVTIRQLTFGEKVQSADATALPVRLAVALLSDRHGVIDIDLPVSGSIHDPQFSVFGLVLRVLGNLIVKAVTAPFALFAGSGGPDLSSVGFEPGTTRLAAGADAVLARVAEALLDRPSLRLTVAGAADPVSERDAIRAATLAARLAEEQRREAARQRTAGREGAAPASAASAPLPEPTPEQRTRWLARLYAEATLPEEKPRTLIGTLKALPPAEMERRLLAGIVVGEPAARELALARGLVVREALAARGLPVERLFLGAPKLRVPGEDTTTTGAPPTVLEVGLR